MNFLKRIIAVAIAVLMVIFLNNIMATVFKEKGTNLKYNDVYETCKELQPTYGAPMESGETAPVVKGDTAKYDECYKAQSKTVEDNRAIAYQQGLIRAFVVMLLAVGAATWLFRRYPYLSGGLIGGGILFLIIYPLMQMGDFMGFGYGYGVSSDVAMQLQTTKLIMASIGFAGLLAADILFFEKESKEPTKLA